MHQSESPHSALLIETYAFHIYDDDDDDYDDDNGEDDDDESYKASCN